MLDTQQARSVGTLGLISSAPLGSPEDLLKHGWPGPTLEVLNLQVWGGPCAFSFLTRSPEGHTVGTTLWGPLLEIGEFATKLSPRWPSRDVNLLLMAGARAHRCRLRIRQGEGGLAFPSHVQELA